MKSTDSHHREAMMSKPRIGAPVTPLPRVEFPKVGKSRDEIQRKLEEFLTTDTKWKRDKHWMFGNVYFAGEDIYEISKNAHSMFMSTNTYIKKAFPSHFRMEEEVLGGIANLFGGEGAAGSMTSGGSESNLLAMLAAREKARKEHPEIRNPEIVLPITGHSSFSKAAHLFDLTPVRVEVDDKGKANVSAMEKAVGENTIAIVGSAAGSPYGVVDPIPELARIAEERHIHLHVDACLGGFVTPFLKDRGYKIPDFDFRVPGVTSISVDPHKYGWSTKPCSCIFYTDIETYRYQETVVSDWAGGIHPTPTLQGTRGGGAVASIWAVMNYLGQEGYSRLAESMMKTTRELIRGINQIQGLVVRIEPDICVFCVETEDESIDIYAVGEGLEDLGWFGISKNQVPPSLVLKVNPTHESVIQAFLDDLKSVTIAVRNRGTKMKEDITY